MPYPVNAEKNGGFAGLQLQRFNGRFLRILGHRDTEIVFRSLGDPEFAPDFNRIDQVTEERIKPTVLRAFMRFAQW